MGSQDQVRIQTASRFKMGLLSIFLLLSLSVAASLSMADSKKVDDQKSSNMNSPKMTKYEGKDEKWLCKKCSKSKFANKHKEDCKKCAKVKDTGVNGSDCSSCSRKKFRERNEFCKKCVNITKKQNSKSNVKAIKKPFGYPAFSSSRVQTKSPAYSKPVIKNEQVELGPFATLLRDLIKANTFIE